MSTDQDSYDIIIAGGGLAGLSLAWYLREGEYEGRILIIDKSLAPRNNKTWCFWSQDDPPFPDIIHKTWSTCTTNVHQNELEHRLDPYSYYCIRSGDFTSFIKRELNWWGHVDFKEEEIQSIESGKVHTRLRIYESDAIFQSALPPQGLNPKKIKYPLIQHFVGWDVVSKKANFDPDVVTFMDFDDAWDDGVGFMYVLPWSNREALLEYTIFSRNPKKVELYEYKIRQYLRIKYSIDSFDFGINRREAGKIPMEDRPYLPWYAPGVMNLGISAGLSKPSTGYTFMRVQKHAKALAESILDETDLVLPTKSPLRFRTYDKMLLHIIDNSSETSLEVFNDLFQNNPIQRIFAFLDEETGIGEDLNIMNSVPPNPFIKAFFAQF
ncbi:MAG: lycopene cyclase family protein [Bacteroidota bacterium]